jgi:hypothetical protein
VTDGQTSQDAQLDTQQWRQQGNNASGDDARHTLQTVRCRRHTTGPVEPVSFVCECTLSEMDVCFCYVYVQGRADLILTE